MSRPAEPPWTPADPAGAPADPPAGPWRAPTGPTRAPDDPTEDWRRLDPRTISASAVLAAGALVVAAVPVGLGLLLGGVGIGWVLLWTIGGVLVGSAATAVAEAIRLAVTGYRVDAHRIDRRVRFLSSTTNSISTGRVRNVEITADVIQRRLGIATVKLASGETDGSRLTLAALDRATAEELRTHVLAGRAGAETSEIARLDPGWVRYAPASLMTPLFGLVGIGLVFQVASWFNAVPALVDWVWERIGTLPWALIGVGGVALAAVVGVVTSVVIFVESWWGLRLDHHRDGSLELRRGLLVGRHTSFDGTRIRGATLYEPPGFRALGAARLDVIATGVGTGKDESGKQKQSPALIPASPRDVPAGVAATVLGEPVPTLFRAHPPAARRRRAVRALAATLALTVLGLVPALIWPWLWWVPVAVLAVSSAVAAWVVIDNYRGLGHATTDSTVALRKGSVLRGTDLLRREGVLGWNLRRTPFQKRAGLVTMVATSAGGTGAFRLPDVGEGDARGIAATAGDVWEHLREPQA